MVEKPRGIVHMNVLCYAAQGRIPQARVWPQEPLVVHGSEAGGGRWEFWEAYLDWYGISHCQGKHQTGYRCLTRALPKPEKG